MSARVECISTLQLSQMSISVAQTLINFLPSWNTRRVAFISMFCTTRGSTCVCSHTNPVIMSVFMKEEGNAYPFFVSTLITRALLPIFSPSTVRINNMFIVVVVVDILTYKDTKCIRPNYTKILRSLCHINTNAI